jgi:putative flippase GtrA
VAVVAEAAAVGWRRRLPEVLRFGAAGLATFGFDLGCLVVLRTFTSLPLAVDAALAFAIAALVNFTLSRQWVFEAAAQGPNPTADLFRYGVLTVVGLAFTAVSVPLLALGMDYRIAKLVASGLGAALNFVALPRWVFVPPKG